MKTSCRKIPRFDYLGAYAHIVKFLKKGTNDKDQQRTLINLCRRIVACHGLSFNEDATDCWQSVALKTLDFFRANLLAQLEEESDTDQCFHAHEDPIFSIEQGWEADVFISQRPQYLNSVLKVYRYHNLGANPRYPGYGWVVNPDETKLKRGSENGIPALPEEPFVPADSLEQLSSRFASYQSLPFFAKIKNTWQDREAFFLEQERVIPLRTFNQAEIFSAASQFLALNGGVYFHSPVVETAVIFCDGDYFLLQDYINNLGYPVTSGGEPNRTHPVIYDGNIMRLTSLQLEAYPALAAAVNLIRRTYPAGARTPLSGEAKPTPCRKFGPSIAYPPPFLKLFAPQWLNSGIFRSNP